jgi:hypothetical protein
MSYKPGAIGAVINASICNCYLNFMLISDSLYYVSVSIVQSVLQYGRSNRSSRQSGRADTRPSKDLSNIISNS